MEAMPQLKSGRHVATTLDGLMNAITHGTPESVSYAILALRTATEWLKSEHQRLHAAATASPVWDTEFWNDDPDPNPTKLPRA